MNCNEPMSYYAAGTTRRVCPPRRRPMICSTTYSRNLRDQYLDRREMRDRAENVSGQLGIRSVVAWSWGGWYMQG